MKTARASIRILLVCLLTAGLLPIGAQASPPASGEIVRGYRVLPIEKSDAEVQLTVYRGDYIKFDFGSAFTGPLLTIPALDVQERLPADLESAPYFKMKTTGTLTFSLGTVSGTITVIDYRVPHYREVTAKEAATLIENIHPLVLDVRTPAEYRLKHLENAILIPVQELQARWQELEAHKNEDVLIYCATGNRSTVAAKILIDAGFKRIYNLRHGIAE